MSSTEKELGRSVALVIDEDGLIPKEGRSVAYVSNLKYCADEPFANQLTLSNNSCTAFLIAPNIVATAMHCLNIIPCNKAVFIFDYYRTGDKTKLSFPTADVYRCKRKLWGALDVGSPDFAIVEIDRVPEGRPPLQLETQSKMEVEAFTLSYPVRLGLKKSQGILQNVSDFESVGGISGMEGSSGAPVINVETKKVEGLLFAGGTFGERDRYVDEENQCYRSLKCEENTPCSNPSTSFIPSRVLSKALTKATAAHK